MAKARPRRPAALPCRPWAPPPTCPTRETAASCIASAATTRCPTSARSAACPTTTSAGGAVRSTRLGRRDGSPSAPAAPCPRSSRQFHPGTQQRLGQIQRRALRAARRAALLVRELHSTNHGILAEATAGGAATHTVCDPHAVPLPQMVQSPFQ